MANLPGSKQLVQTESVEYRAGVSESSLQSMASAVNYCLFNTPPIGSIIASFLTEVQFQAETDATWILADGRSIAGSDFSTLTGLGVAPDLRGEFLRGKDNGRGTNPDGEIALGTGQGDEFAAHSHSGGANAGHVTGSGAGADFYTTQGTVNVTIGSTGGNETRPRNVTVNYFVKINA